jgi:hypothetical protein
VLRFEYVRASGPYAGLHVRDRRYVIRATMQAVERWVGAVWRS